MNILYKYKCIFNNEYSMYIYTHMIVVFKSNKIVVFDNNNKCLLGYSRIFMLEKKKG